MRGGTGGALPDSMYSKATPIVGALLFALTAGCASSASDDVADDALAANPKTTVLVTEGTGPQLELVFGLDAHRKPIVTASRGGQRRVLACESAVFVDEGTSSKVTTTCTDYARDGDPDESCAAILERTDASSFEMLVLCASESNGQATPLATPLADTYEILSGKRAPQGRYSAAADRYGITLREQHRGTDPFGDEIAFAEALAPAMRPLLGRVATIKTFAGPIADIPVDRATAHTDLAHRSTQLGAFASAYEVELAALSLEGAGGSFASGDEVVSRVRAQGVCAECPDDMPHCLK